MPNIGKITDVDTLKKMRYAGKCHARRILKDDKDPDFGNTDKLGMITTELVAVNLRIEELEGE